MKYEFRYYTPKSLKKVDEWTDDRFKEDVDYIVLLGYEPSYPEQLWSRWLTLKSNAGKASSECIYKELMGINSKTFNRIIRRRTEVMDEAKNNPLRYIEAEIEKGSKQDCFQWRRVG